MSTTNSKEPESAQDIKRYFKRLEDLHKVWKAQPHQAKVIDAIFGKRQMKRVFIRGGRKSAKTELVLYLAHRMAIQGPKKVCSIIGPSRIQQNKIVWNNRRLIDFAPKDWKGTPFKSQTMIEFPWGSFIDVDGSENTESHRGEEQDLLILDELKDHSVDSYEAMYPNLAARDGVLVVIGSPPKEKDGLFYPLEQAARQDPKTWLVCHWTIWDNKYIPRPWIEKEKAAYYVRGDGYLWEREFEGKYVFGGKSAVFSMFDPKKHVLPHDVILDYLAKDRHKLEYFTVTDPGNRVCHGTLFIAFNSFTNQVWVLDEIYEQDQAETSVGKIFPRIMEREKELYPDKAKQYYIYDEAALWYSVEVNAQFLDFRGMTPTSKAAADKETSIGVIKDCFINDKLKISDRCVCLVGEILGYYLDKNGRYKKKDDHLIDPLRYFYDFIGYTSEMGVLNVNTNLGGLELGERGILRDDQKDGDEGLFEESMVEGLWN